MKALILLSILFFTACKQEEPSLNRWPVDVVLDQEFFINRLESTVGSDSQNNPFGISFKVRLYNTKENKLHLHCQQFIPVWNESEGKNETQYLSDVKEFTKGVFIEYDVDSFGQFQGVTNSAEIKRFVDSLFNQNIVEKEWALIEGSWLDNFKETFLTEELIVEKNTQFIRAFHMAYDSSYINQEWHPGFPQDLAYFPKSSQTKYENDSVRELLIVSKDTEKIFLPTKWDFSAIDSCTLQMDLKKNFLQSMIYKRRVRVDSIEKVIQIIMKEAI